MATKVKKYGEYSSGTSMEAPVFKPEEPKPEPQLAQGDFPKGGVTIVNNNPPQTTNNIPSNDPDPTGSKWIQQREQTISRLQEAGASPASAKRQTAEIMANMTPLSPNRTVAEVVANQQKQKALLGKVGQINPQQTQEIPTDFGSAAKAGVGTLGIGAASGLTAGLIAAPATGGLSIPVGIAAGAATDFIRGFTGKLKRDSNENIAAEFTTLADSKRAIRAIISQINSKDPSLPIDDAIELFNEQLASIDRAERQIKMESMKDLNKFLGVDAQVKLRKMINFNSPGGLREIYTAQMMNAIANPDPSRPLPFDEIDLEAMS